MSKVNPHAVRVQSTNHWPSRLQSYLLVLHTRKFQREMKIKLATSAYRPLGIERVYLPLYKVVDTPFRNLGDNMS